MYTSVNARFGISLHYSHDLMTRCVCVCVCEITLCLSGGRDPVIQVTTVLWVEELLTHFLFVLGTNRRMQPVVMAPKKNLSTKH